MDKNKIEFIVFKFFVNLVCFLGRRKSMKLAEFLGAFFYYIIPVRKEVVKKNLSIAFPELSKNEAEKLAKRNYVHILKTFFDTFLLSSVSKEEVTEILKIGNIRLLREEFEKGGGVVLLTGHFGNWELGAVGIGVAMNEEINVLTKPQRNPLVSKWMDNVRERFGNKVSNLGAGVRELFKTLRSGGMIGIVGDQRGPREGMRIKIFGKDTAVYSGFAALIAKSKAPVVIALAPREEDDSYSLEFIKMNYKPDDDAEKIAQKYMSILEEYIRNYPEQWFWMHNIWKY